MNTEHALPHMDDWRGDHFKSSDESNATGWLRYLFVREEGSQLLIGQAVPRDWLKDGQRCGIERTATHFGPTSVMFSGGKDEITAELRGPQRNPPVEIRLRFRDPKRRAIASSSRRRDLKHSNRLEQLPATLSRHGESIVLSSQ